MKKSDNLYLYIVAGWMLLVTITLPWLLLAFVEAIVAGWVYALLVGSSTLFIVYFWLNGMKDLVYPLYYHFTRPDKKVPPRGAWSRRYGVNNRPDVVMVYCTYNDFNAHSLATSMRQDYQNYRVVILDDSTKPAYKQAIDRFAAQHGLEVVRRTGHAGFKAGNLNNYLKSARYDYFVILDSDEIVPQNFISRALDYFAANRTTGILQAHHIATRNRNSFMKMFALGVDSHWIAYQSVKDRSGFLSLSGHGAMVSRACYEAAGGFPHVVAEDLCFSIMAKEGGFETRFAPDIVCEEEYPIDYLAFKKRHNKWTQGNMEFIKRFTGTIIRSDMRWFEKLDMVLFTYNLPLTAFFALYVAIQIIVLPALGYHINYPLWMFVPTIIFMIAPMLNDIITYRGKMPSYKIAWYLFHSFLLYGSMLYISLVASFKSLFGKSVFLVTPKTNNNISLWQSLAANRGEVMFGGTLTAAALHLSHTVLPVVLIALPSFLSVYIAMMANAKRKRVRELAVSTEIA